MTASLIEMAQRVLPKLDAPAAYVHSQIVGPDLDEESANPEEHVALDRAVAERMAAAGLHVVYRAGPGRAIVEAPRTLLIEAVVAGPDGDTLAEAVRAVDAALDAGVQVRAVLASGDTGFDAYRVAAAARQALGARVPIRVRWDDVLDCKGAALALTFGADELAGPLAPPKLARKLAQIGGPPEDGHHPSAAYVESLIRAAGRLPSRRVYQGGRA